MLANAETLKKNYYISPIFYVKLPMSMGMTLVQHCTNVI